MFDKQRINLQYIKTIQRGRHMEELENKKDLIFNIFSVALEDWLLLLLLLL